MGRELLAQGSLPHNNPYSYSAPGFPWLRHEWLSEVVMATIFDGLGPLGLKLLKFACTAGTICFVASAESETGAPVTWQAAILLVVALILAPVMQFRPQLFDFLLLSAIIALLARHNWRASAPLWIAIPIVAIWSNFHGGFFIGLLAMGSYGATTTVLDIFAGLGPRRGLDVLAITAAAAASTLCTFLIPPARDTWYTPIHEIMNPMTRTTMADWKPLLVALTSADSGSVEQKYFVVVLLFFAAAVLSVILKPGGADAPMVAVAAVMLATALTAVRNVPMAAIAIAPVITNHISRLAAGRTIATPPADADRSHQAPRFAMEILVAVVGIGFARYNGILKRGIDASDNPGDAVDFMNSHRLAGNVLADYAWGQYVIWHCAPGTKVFIDSRYDLSYPPAVIRDYVALDNGTAGGTHTLAAYPHDFVLLKKDSPAAKLMESQPAWWLIYSDQVAMLYARRGADAASIPAIPVSGTSHRWQFP